MNSILLADYALPFDPLKIWIKYCGFHTLKKRNKYYCGCCGKEIHECSCGAKRTSEKKVRLSGNENSIYYNHMQVIKNHLLIRTFVIKIGEECDRPHSSVFYSEVMRFVYNDQFKMLWCRKPTYSLGFYYWDWRYDEEFKIRKLVGSRQDNLILYNYGGRKPKWLKYFDLNWLKKYNIFNDKISMNDLLNMNDLLMLYHEDPVYTETMLKLKRYDLFNCYIKNKELKYALWTVLKNDKKLPCSAYDYCIYLNRLIYFSKDIKNINVVMPKDFKKEYAKLEKKFKMVLAKKDLEEAKAKQESYYKRVANLPIIKDDNKTTIPIKEIQDFYHFGEEVFHNCLFSNKYYEKECSYCFIINIDDKPTECCELLKTDNDLIIQQIRGVCNSASDYHEQIKLFVHDKLEIFKELI